MSFTLPTPAQRWAALKEWEAGRRRFWSLPKAALFVRPESEKDADGKQHAVVG